MCKPVENCYEKATWLGVSVEPTVPVRLGLNLQIVTPAYDQTATDFDQGTLIVQDERFKFRFAPELSSTQVTRMISDTLIRNTRYERILVFQTSATNPVSQVLLAREGGIIGFTIRNTGSNFWRKHP